MKERLTLCSSQKHVNGNLLIFIVEIQQRLNGFDHHFLYLSSLLLFRTSPVPSSWHVEPFGLHLLVDIAQINLDTHI